MSQDASLHSLGPTPAVDPTDATYQVAKRRAASRRVARRTITHIVLLVGSVIMLAPLAWLVSTSFKKSGQEWVYPPVWIPNPIYWQNYIEAMDVLPVPFYRYVFNTLLITCLATLGTVFSCSLAAFSFARLRFRGRDFMFALVISTMILPGAVTLIPTFLIFRYLGWLDTFLPLIVPFWLGSSAFSIFLLRQFFLTIPMELDEAARMDGASSLRIYRSIVLPLAKPALATVVIFQVLWRWNEFMEPMIYLNSMENYTVALALRAFQNVRSQRINYLMALSAIQVAPVMILFFVAQKYFIRGISLSGISGR
jgi:ABC-type glycerol-3-phosphate transport system permease component